MTAAALGGGMIRLTQCNRNGQETVYVQAEHIALVTPPLKRRDDDRRGQIPGDRGQAYVQLSTADPERAYMFVKETPEEVAALVAEALR